MTNEGGGVAVTATWAGIDAGATFDVALDTHSGDLDSIDLADGVLRNDGGDELTAPAWSAPAGGHHRSGELRFGGDSQSFLASATWIELVLFDIGGVPERVLRWNLV